MARDRNDPRPEERGGALHPFHDYLTKSCKWIIERVDRCERPRCTNGCENELIISLWRKFDARTVAELTRIDIGRVGALGSSLILARKRKAAIKLAAEVLRITRLEPLFDIHSSESEAVAAFLNKE